MKFQPVAVFAALLLFALELGAQTTAFTYQGQLSSNGVAANGLYDLRFQLFNVSSNSVGNPVTNSPTGVTNGLFTATLNFGSTVFDGSDRWLQIAVRNYGNTNDYTALSPLQPITSVPYAIRSINAASATNALNAINLTSPLRSTNIAGIILPTNLPVNVAYLTSNQMFTASNAFSGTVTATNTANYFVGTFVGDGGGLTALPATNLTGTVPDARLSANVALQSNAAVNFAGNVTASNFTGAGHGLTNVPGAFFWVVPTNGQIYPNVGYICTNDITPVTLILPGTNSASVGDTYKVAGAGAAGWIITQTNGETIFSGNLSDNVGQSWNTNGPVANWSAITASADGSKLVALINGANLYTSTNFGATWTSRGAVTPGNQSWSAVASSANGLKLVAVAGYTVYNTAGTGQIWTSTDGGVNWTARDSSRGWSGVASSADGTRLIACVRNGQIYSSVNSGVNWTARDSVRNWTSVASSADGMNLAATVDGGGIYTSVNGGTNWTQVTNSTLSWTHVASSSDGTRLVATSKTGDIYISTDSGGTWNAANSPTGGSRIACIAASADSARLAIVIGDTAATGNIYGSSDSGSTWPLLSGAPVSSWSSIASSSDGGLLAATVHGGKIYISSQAGTTTGASGYLVGSQHSAIELIYTGDGNFLPLNHEGTIRAY